MEVAHVEKGDVKASVKIESGKVIVSSSLGSKGVEGSIALSFDAGYFIDELAKAIPGTVDDAILAVVKAALLAKV